MACVGGTASAARLKRPKSSAQRGDGLRGRRHPPLGRAGEVAAQTNFPDAAGRMLVARPDFGRCPQHWRPPGSSDRACSAAMEARLGWLRVCNVRTHALTKGLRPFFNQKRAPPLRGPPGPEDSRATPLGGMDHGTVMARVHVEFGQVSHGRECATLKCKVFPKKPYGPFSPAL